MSPNHAQRVAEALSRRSFEDFKDAVLATLDDTIITTHNMLCLTGGERSGSQLERASDLRRRLFQHNLRLVYLTSHTKSEARSHSAAARRVDDYYACLSKSSSGRSKLLGEMMQWLARTILGGIAEMKHRTHSQRKLQELEHAMAASSFWSVLLETGADIEIFAAAMDQGVIGTHIMAERVRNLLKACSRDNDEAQVLLAEPLSAPESQDIEMADVDVDGQEDRLDPKDSAAHGGKALQTVPVDNTLTPKAPSRPSETPRTADQQQADAQRSSRFRVAKALLYGKLDEFKKAVLSFAPSMEAPFECRTRAEDHEPSEAQLSRAADCAGILSECIMGLFSLHLHAEDSKLSAARHRMNIFYLCRASNWEGNACKPVKAQMQWLAAHCGVPAPGPEADPLSWLKTYVCLLKFWESLLPDHGRATQYFIDALTPHLGDAEDIQRSLKAILGVAVGCADDARSLLNELSASSRQVAGDSEMVDADADSQARIVKVEDYDNDQGPTVIPSTAPLRLTTLTDQCVGIDSQIEVAFERRGEPQLQTLDTGCQASSISRKLLQQHLPNVRSRQFPRPFSVLGVFGGAVTREYVVLTIYLPGHDPLTGKEAVASITHQFDVDDGDGMLIGQDVVVQHELVINPANQTVTIGRCGGMVIELVSEEYFLPQEVVGPDEEEAERSRVEMLEQEMKESHGVFL